MIAERREWLVLCKISHLTSYICSEFLYTILKMGNHSTFFILHNYKQAIQVVFYYSLKEVMQKPVRIFTCEQAVKHYLAGTQVLFLRRTSENGLGGGRQACRGKDNTR